MAPSDGGGRSNTVTSAVRFTLTTFSFGGALVFFFFALPPEVVLLGGTVSEVVVLVSTPAVSTQTSTTSRVM